MKLLSSLDLFSGVGGITRALEGIARPIAYCEIDEDCKTILKRNMESGLLPKAPIFSDVCELTASKLRRKFVDIMVGGWPCQDLSSMGLRKGLDGDRSGLITEVFRLADELKPKLVFLENVPIILVDGIDVIIKEFVQKRGYEMRWATVSAGAMGAPHNRKRWFCLLIKKESDIDTYSWDLTKSGYRSFSWGREPVIRMKIPKNVKEKVGMTLRLSMCGNSVVPDAVRAAFITLLEGFSHTPAPSMLKQVPFIKLEHPHVEKLIAIKKSKKMPKWGMAVSSPVQEGKVFYYKVRPYPKMLRPNFGIVVNPHAVKREPVFEITTERIKKPVKLRCWSTPRHTTTMANVLTRRTIRDLPTQIRFEKNTPDHVREGAVNPCFVEWMMGYPTDWTKALAK